VSSSHIFAVALAVTLFVSADALFPLLVSGGQEIDIDTAATARVRTLGWMAAYLLCFVCLAISWRGAIEAIRQNLVFVLLIALDIFSAMWSDNPLRVLPPNPAFDAVRSPSRTDCRPVRLLWSRVSAMP
jgi:hypothetical protein